MRILRFTLTHQPIPKLSLFKDESVTGIAWASKGKEPNIQFTGINASRILSTDIIIEIGKEFSFTLLYDATVSHIGVYSLQVIFLNGATAVNSVDIPLVNGTNLVAIGSMTSQPNTNRIGFRVVMSGVGTSIDLTVKSLTAANTFVVSEPEGWKGALCGFERHPEFFSLVEFYKSEFSFYGSNGSEDGGRNKLKAIELAYGPDAEIEVVVETSDDLIEEWEVAFRGSIPLIMLVEAVDLDHTLKIPFAPQGFWTRFINRFESSVNIRSTEDLDGGLCTVYDSKTLKLPTQKIRQQYLGYRQYNKPLGSADIFEDLHIDFDQEPLDEIKEKYNYPCELTREEDGSPGFAPPKFVVEFDGTYTFTLVIGLHCSNTIGTDPGSTNGFMNLFLQVNQFQPVQFSSTNIQDVPAVPSNRWYTKYELSYTVDLRKNDSVRIYGHCYQDDGGNFYILGQDGFDKIGVDKFNGYWDASTGLFPESSDAYDGLLNGALWIISIPGTLDGVAVEKDWVIVGLSNGAGQSAGDWYINQNGRIEGTWNFAESTLEVTAATTYPETEVEAMLIHDIGASITERIIGQDECFHSPYLGNSVTAAKQYEEDGHASFYTALKGLHLRGYTYIQKIFSMSMKDFWQGANPIFNLGLGYDVIDGKDTIVIDKKEKFFDASDVSVTLYNVRKIERVYDHEQFYFNQIEVGYDKWNSDDVLGIDDPQTKRKWATIFKNIGKPFSIISKWIAASLAIERSRRETIVKSKDFKYDDDTFIINVVEDGAGLKPRIDESFTETFNLFDSDTRYNKVITCARNFLRWSNFIYGCLQSYLNSKLTFVEGQGNYEMSATMEASSSVESFGGFNLSEKQTFTVNNDILFIPQLWKIEHILTEEQYKAIQANRNLAIGISQTETNVKKFFIKSLEWERDASGESGNLRLLVWPKEPFNIQVIDGEVDHETGTVRERIFDDSFSSEFE